MKSVVVADSSALISLASVTDSNHELAKKVSGEIGENSDFLIVPGEVLTETVNVFGRKISHDLAASLANEIISSEDLLLMETTADIRSVALAKFINSADSVSFTDCLVMAFADHSKTKLIFGFDEIFRKKGYLRVGVD